MIHSEKAFEAMPDGLKKFICLHGRRSSSDAMTELNIRIQTGTVKDYGVNGLQATDLLLFVKEMFISLNNAYPCMENYSTIHHIEEAIKQQEDRTNRRQSSGIEGINTEDAMVYDSQSETLSVNNKEYKELGPF